MYVYCVICYCLIAAPYVSIGHVFAHCYTLEDDFECPMYYEFSLLPKVFPILTLITLCVKVTIYKEYILYFRS